MRLPRSLGLLLLLSTFSCSSTPSARDTTMDGIVTADDLGAPEPDEDLPVFVVVHRNTRLYTRASEDAPFVQFRTPEEERALEEAERERLRQIAEKERLAAERKKAAEKKRALARKKKKKKRRKKRRKKRKVKPPTPEQIQAAKERAHRARVKRARASLRDVSRKATRDPMAHPNRQHAVLRLLKEDGKWAYVETLSAREQAGHCHQGAHPGLSEVRLRLYVRVSELETILTRPEKLSVHKLTRVHLQPGVILTPGEEKSVAHVDGYAFTLPIPDDVIGTRYSHPHVYPQSETNMAFSPIAWAESLIKIDKKRPFAFSPHYDLFVQEVGRAGKYAYSTLQTRCGEYVVRSRPEWVETLTSRAVKRIGGDAVDISLPYIKKGARLTSPSGEVLGSTVDDVPVRKSVGAQTSCFELPVWHGAPRKGRSVKVCAAEQDVVTE